MNIGKLEYWNNQINKTMEYWKTDEFVKSPLGPFFVIPAPFCNGVNSSRNPGFPVKTGIHNDMSLVPCLRRDNVWTPVGIYPDGNRDRSDGLRTFYETIKIEIMEYWKNQETPCHLRLATHEKKRTEKREA